MSEQLLKQMERIRELREKRAAALLEGASASTATTALTTLRWTTSISCPTHHQLTQFTLHTRHIDRIAIVTGYIQHALGQPEEGGQAQEESRTCQGRRKKGTVVRGGLPLHIPAEAR